MATSEEFSGKTALVTGGSRGIGRAVAIRLAADGARVAINYVSHETEARDVLGQIKSSGGTATFAQGDIAEPDEARRIAQKARDALGPIDILVHCAGVATVQPAGDVTWEIWKRTMDVNLDGTFNMIYAVKDEMIKRRFGRIVAISSIAALRPRKFMIPYATSKAAVVALVRSCAEAWAQHNLRINCVCPGLIDTDMTRTTLADDVWQQMADATPMRRVGQPKEIASVVRFLLSEESSFMTGQSVVASGGRVTIPG